MNRQSTETNTPSPQRRPSWHRWPEWIGYATAAWSAAYGLLGLLWTLGGAGFPFGVGHDPHAEVSVLSDADPTMTGALIAVLGLAGAAVAVVMGRRQVRRSLRGLLVFAWSLSAVLVLLIPDGRLLIAVIRAPMILIGRPLGLTELGFSEYFETFWPWSVVNQAVLILGGVLWAATAIGYRRRLDNTCLRCGRSRTGRRGWTAPEAAARWGRWAVAVAVAVPVGYAATRWAWALDIPLGITQEALDSEGAESPGIWGAGAILATMALGGAVLTLGLVQKWGEIYPRWIPRLRGRRVRERTAVIPASLVATLITSTGLTNLRAHMLEGYDIEWEVWGMYAPQMFFPLWGTALGAATLAYHLRRRGRCGACGLGSPEPGTAQPAAQISWDGPGRRRPEGNSQMSQYET
jgi:hypothetical protein